MRKSNVDFPLSFEKEAPMVKNTKVNAQLVPLDYQSASVASNLPPTMTRDELMNLAKNHKN